MRRIKRFIWEQDAWPAFRWDAERLLLPLGAARRAQGEFAGLLGRLSAPERAGAELVARTDEVVETADIEGESIDARSARSSLARRLRIDESDVVRADAKTEGLVDMTLDATREFMKPLTISRLLAWHIGLFPIELGARRTIAIGAWRDDASGPMQVVSGRLDRPTVHFEAPPAGRIEREIEAFLQWFENVRMDGLMHSALAHLWFVTIHPFDDGNGRVARAIADMALARDDASPHRYISMSREMNRRKAAYYAALESAQRGNLDSTAWIEWYIACYTGAVVRASGVVGEVLRAKRFWQAHADVRVSERQQRVLARYLGGFEGLLTAKKWATIVKVSPDTAQRDIADLVTKGVLVKNSGGSKNTSYTVT